MFRVGDKVRARVRARDRGRQKPPPRRSDCELSVEHRRPSQSQAAHAQIPAAGTWFACTTVRVRVTTWLVCSGVRYVLSAWPHVG